MSEIANRADLNQTINDLFNHSLTYSLWRKVSGIFSRIPGLQGVLMPFWLSALLVMIICVSVSFFVAWILGAIWL